MRGPCCAVILCSVPADTSRLRCPAPKALAQRPLGMVGPGRGSPGLTSSLLWGLAGHCTRCQSAESGRGFFLGAHPWA